MFSSSKKQLHVVLDKWECENNNLKFNTANILENIRAIDVVSDELEIQT